MTRPRNAGRALTLATLALLGPAGCSSSGTAPVAPPAIEAPVAPDALVGEVPLPGAVISTAAPLTLTPKLELDGDGTTSLKELRNVRAIARVMGALGRYEVAVEFITPSQVTFERRSIELLGTTPGLQDIPFELPVAGTLIDSANLTGVWSARFLLDGQEIAVQDFELTP